MMTVDEVSQRAKSLERTFVAMLVDFEKTTGCHIDSIDLRRPFAGTLYGEDLSAPELRILVRIPTP